MGKKAIIGLMACAALASCQTADLDKTIQSNLPRTCALIDTAHAAFIAASVSGSISKKTIRTENAAYVSAQTVCAHPESVTAENALIVAAQAYASISLSLKAARK
jgi:hypothetical protein